MDCNNLVCTIPACRISGNINPESYKPATGFITSESVSPEGMRKSYTTRDARLVNSPRAMQTYLDMPPYDGSVWMDDVYNPLFVPPEYNRGYSSYNIVPGQIMYYVDPDVAPAFRKQIYNLDGHTMIDMFKTPMGKIEPTFYLVPPQKTFNYLSKDTFARDQLTFRNDITSLQQRGHNKQRFEAIK